MPRTTRDSKWYQAECVLSDYYKNKKAVERLKRDIIFRTANKPEISSMPSTTSDNTGRRGIACVEDEQILRYEADIRAVERLIGNEKMPGEYEHHHKWYEIKKAIELRYWKGTHSMQGVSMWLLTNKDIEISERWLGCLVSEFIWRLREVLYGEDMKLMKRSARGM